MGSLLQALLAALLATLQQHGAAGAAPTIVPLFVPGVRPPPERGRHAPQFPI